MNFRKTQPVTFGAVIAIGLIVFLISFYRMYEQQDYILEKPKHLRGGTRPSFHEIARKYGTDKVLTHSYQNMYQKYLEPLRDQSLKMLEIGLGCDMGYGPGASYHTWLEFFPHVDLYYIEYDAKCAEKWAASTTAATVFTGDQADIAFLQEFLAARD